MNAFATADRNHYGANETNGLINGHEYHDAVDYSRQYTLGEVKDLGGKITRVRLLQEYNRVDVSYIHATLSNGKTVPVYIEVGNCMPANKVKKEFMDWAQRHGVYAKGIGLIDEGNWSVLR